VRRKYQLVKQVDRVGRMADTLEFSKVALPRSRFSQELIAELYKEVPSLIEEDGDDLIIKHLYIERRMEPLNLYLEKVEKAGRDDLVEEACANTAMRSANWRSPIFFRATCCGRTLASPVTVGWCSTITTKSNT
jgi:isocitrate dehydrogenase kinase/phosphatase